MITQVDLNDEDKLPPKVMAAWKEDLDNQNFSERIGRKPEANKGMTYLRDQFMEVVQSYPVRDRSDSGESTVMLPDTKCCRNVNEDERNDSEESSNSYSQLSGD